MTQVLDEGSYAYVGIGSNLGDRARYLVLAIRGMLDAGIRITRLTSIYETEPVGVIEQPQFLNMVAELAISEHSPGPQQLMARLLRVEYGLGRRRDVPGGPRVIDLDLLLYGTEQIRSEFLTIPHPRLHERSFVLAPLAEIRPDLLHPVLHRTVDELLSEVKETPLVQRWQPDARPEGKTEMSNVGNPR